jgi:hypothetical protein
VSTHLHNSTLWYALSSKKFATLVQVLSNEVRQVASLQPNRITRCCRSTLLIRVSVFVQNIVRAYDEVGFYVTTENLLRLTTDT